jgi:N-hydroxyarylamine O-acetyltransferase
MANWYTSCHPKSRFINRLMAARAANDRRYALLDNEFIVRHLNGKTERQVLSSGADIREVLEGPMGLALPATPELEVALNRIASTNAHQGNVAGSAGVRN